MIRIILLLSSLLMTMPLMASCSDDETTPYDENSDFSSSGKTKTLVAYFSVTGNTNAVAERIAGLTGADTASSPFVRMLPTHTKTYN